MLIASRSLSYVEERDCSLDLVLVRLVSFECFDPDFGADLPLRAEFNIGKVKFIFIVDINNSPIERSDEELNPNLY
jgi:hypothetical protein